MNDSKLYQELQSAGMEWFAEYYRELSDRSLHNRDLIEQVRMEKDYKRDSSRTKVCAGRRIIRARRGKDALNLIANSKNDRASVLALGQLEVLSRDGEIAEVLGGDRTP